MIGGRGGTNNGGETGDTTERINKDVLCGNPSFTTHTLDPTAWKPSYPVVKWELDRRRVDIRRPMRAEVVIQRLCACGGGSDGSLVKISSFGFW